MYLCARPRYVPVPSIERSPRELLQIVSCLHKGGCKSFSGIQSKLLRKAGRFDLCRLRFRPKSAGTTAISDIINAVDVEVERAPRNSRRIYAGVDVNAPVELVWDALTDYENLHQFIPGLAENRCLERRARGCKLLQVGEQDIALGAKFRARVILDIEEHRQGAPRSILHDIWDVDNELLYPEPRSPVRGAPCRDILFAMVEGDFQAFKGVWRMQSREAGGGWRTRLSYSVFVRPQLWLPVGLIQARIQDETQRNLAAVRLHSEALARSAGAAS